MIIPVSCVVTKTHLKEFMLLKFSLEQYHECKWYIASDTASHNILKDFPNIVSQEFPITDGKVDIDGPESTENFFNTIMYKFVVARTALKAHGHVLSVDTDIIFTNRMDIHYGHFLNNTDLDVAVSPHYQWNPMMDNDWGRYNVGFQLLKSERFLDAWENLTRQRIYKFEQVPMAKLLEDNTFNFAEFPINYNMGWWRFNNAQSVHRVNSFYFRQKRLMFDGLPVVCFHFHTFVKDVHSPQFRNAVIPNLAKSEGYHALLTKIQEIEQSTL